MALASYDELLEELEEWLNRNDLTGRAPTLIRMFEARMNRRLSEMDMEAVATSTTTADEQEYALPDDYGQMRALYLDTDPKVRLEYMAPDAFHDTFSAETGKPYAYTLQNGALLLGPIPDGDYSLVMSYNQDIPALTSTNQTNWLLDRHPDIYLYGSLMRANGLLQDDPRAAWWKSIEEEAIDEILAYARRRRVGAGPLQIRPTVFE